MGDNMNIIIPICGEGKRFYEENYDSPKPLIRALGKQIIFWNLQNIITNIGDTIFIIYRKEFEIYNFESIINNEFQEYNFKFIQVENNTRGAAETVLCAIDIMDDLELERQTLILDSDNIYQKDIVSITRDIGGNLIFFTIDSNDLPIFSYIKISDNSNVIDIKEKEKISDMACIGAYAFKNSKILREYVIELIKSGETQKKEYYISSVYKSMLENGEIIKSKESTDFDCLGTPGQLKSFSSSFNNKMDKCRFCFDLDNTLVTYPTIKGDYSTVKPIKKTIDFLNFLHSLGHTIIIHTARRMKTHGGNIGSVQADIALVTLKTLDEFKIKYDEIYFGKPYANFYIDDLSLNPAGDLEKGTGFYNIHPETRDHNRIEILENKVKKYSSDISGEEYFYINIPEKVSDFFPKILDSGENYITIEKIKGIPVSFINSNKTLTKDIIFSILDHVEILHSSKISTDEIDIYENYSKKLNRRILNYDISKYTNSEYIIEENLKYLEKYEIEKRGKLSVIHGDPVFSNILIDNNNRIKFIDMRGKIGKNLTIFGDSLYDYSKIYQSITGYDFVLMDKEIDPLYIEKNKKIFSEWILKKYETKGPDILLDIKEITKSLILSLLPIHNNEKCINYYKLIETI
jgi:capsule biosynthesis phosphatase